MKLSQLDIDLLLAAQKRGMSHASMLKRDFFGDRFEVLLVAKNEVMAREGINFLPNAITLKISDILQQCASDNNTD